MSKTEADGLYQISIQKLKEFGFIKQGFRCGNLKWTHSPSGNVGRAGICTTIDTNGNDHIQLRYTQTDFNGEKKDFDYKISLTSTDCNFGGKRYWFICPFYKNSEYCGKRVGVLYKDGDYFSCRHCYELTYHSRKENRNWQYHSFFRYLDLEKKYEELDNQIKRRSYAGKLTKKQRKLGNLIRKKVENFALMKSKNLV